MIQDVSLLKDKTKEWQGYLCRLTYGQIARRLRELLDNVPLILVYSEINRAREEPYIDVVHDVSLVAPSSSSFGYVLNHLKIEGESGVWTASPDYLSILGMCTNMTGHTTVRHLRFQSNEHSQAEAAYSSKNVYIHVKKNGVTFKTQANHGGTAITALYHDSPFEDHSAQALLAAAAVRYFGPGAAHELQKMSARDKQDLAVMLATAMADDTPAWSVSRSKPEVNRRRFRLGDAA